MDPSFQDLVDRYNAWRADYFKSNWYTPDFLLNDRVAPLDKDRDQALALYASGDPAQMGQAMALIKAGIVAAGMSISDSTQTTSGAGGVSDMPSLADEAKAHAAQVASDAAAAASAGVFAVGSGVKTGLYYAAAALAVVVVVVVVVKVAK